MPAFQGSCSAVAPPTCRFVRAEWRGRACDGILVGEDADDIGVALDFAVDPLQRVRAVDFGAMLLGERYERQHVGLGAVHAGGETMRPA